VENDAKENKKENEEQGEKGDSQAGVHDLSVNTHDTLSAGDISANCNRVDCCENLIASKRTARAALGS
jgi:hypothetical protein